MRTCPKDAKPTTPYFTDNYWKHPENQAINIFDPSVPFGVPFAPTPFRVTFHVKAGDAEVTRDVPVQFRYVKDIYNGDKRMELNVVPGVFGAGDAAPGGDSGTIRAEQAGDARGQRHRDQRHEGRGAGQRDARICRRDGRPLPRACRSVSRMRTNRCRRASR